MTIETDDPRNGGDATVRVRRPVIGPAHEWCARKAAESHAEPRTDRPGTPTNHDR